MGRRPRRTRPPPRAREPSTRRRPSDRDDHAADANPTAPEPVGYEPATLEDGTPVPASELAQVLCDCAVTRIAIGADGTPLDLGRTQRLFTGEQRRAVIARDRECIWPGCHMPARWSQIHHIVWWERDNGRTCVDDGCLLCAFHHHEVHRLDLTITRITRTPDEPPPRSRATRLPGRRAPGHPAPHHPAGGDATTVALVDYELRDPTGRLIGESDQGAALSVQGAAPAVEASALPLADGTSQVKPRVRIPTRDDVDDGGNGVPRAPRDSTAGQRPGAGTDELDLGWVTDPFTGMRMPAFMVDR